MINKGEQMKLLMDAIRVTQKWYSTYGALNIGPKYAQILLDVFSLYFPDRSKWVLVKREHPESPYELRYAIEPGDFYVVALVPISKIGYIRDIFGPTYAEQAVPYE